MAYWDGRAGGEWTEEQMTEQSETQLKSELHSLQLALERWAMAHEIEDGDADRHWGNNYPDSLSQLMIVPCCPEHPDSGAYAQPGFYPNPFSDVGVDNFNARSVPFGWKPGVAGNFSYITQYNELGNVCAYVLIAWGGTQGSGHDIDGDGQADGAVIMLAGGEPLDHYGMARRNWSAEQREAARLLYWDGGQQVELNWPK